MIGKTRTLYSPIENNFHFDINIVIIIIIANQFNTRDCHKLKGCRQHQMELRPNGVGLAGECILRAESSLSGQKGGD